MNTGEMIDLSLMFSMQRELDEKILDEFCYGGEELHVHRRLAFLDEVAELMNKTRVHKYWSKKEMDERDELLEEYVDGLHFLLTIGNDLHVPNAFFSDPKPMNLLESFDAIFTTATIIYSPIGWQLTMTLFVGLGEALSFEWEEDIVPAYYKKYKINQERLKNGY